MKNTIKWLGIIAIIAIVGFSVTSCWGDRAKLIGVWEGEGEGRLEILANGNMILDGMPGTWSLEWGLGGNKLKFKPSGTMVIFPFDYELDDNMLTLNYEGGIFYFFKANTQ